MEPIVPESNLQLELLALLSFHDKEGEQVRAAFDLELYDQKPIQRLAKKIYSFYDNFHTAPKTHIGDIFKDFMVGEQRPLYEDLYSRLMEMKDNVNVEYTLSKFNEFLSRQVLSKGIEEAYGAMENGNLEEAKKILNTASKHSATFTDLGLDIADSPEAIYKEQPDREFTTGIAELDMREFYPARQELMLIIGLMGKGKTWMLVHMGVHNLRMKKKILHISLEMGSRKVAERYIRSLFKLTHNKGASVPITNISATPTGDYIFSERVETRPGMWDADTKETLETSLSGQHNRLIIKEFPPRVLTIPRLEAYIDALEQQKAFIPDMLIVDYPDLFAFNPSKELRQEIGEVTMQLRRISKERNIAVIGVSQSNRGGASKDVLTEKDLSEDFSKGFTADRIASFNRTEEEEDKNVARIRVLKNRDNARPGDVIIAQALDIGQFSVASVMHSEYYDNLKAQLPSKK